MAEIKVKPSLAVRARLRVLYDIVNEMARAFSVDNQESVTQTLHRGIFERQYLSAVHIYLLDEVGKKQAQITLEIDWKLHQVRIESGDREWEVDPSRSLLEQVSGVYRVIVEHMERMKAAFGIVRSEVWYTYRSDVPYREA